jgi:hypothetical protein
MAIGEDPQSRFAFAIAGHPATADRRSDSVTEPVATPARVSGAFSG